MAIKGIILAGGSGSRLYPVTRAVSKQLVPVYDKPMIYYPLATLMLSGIRDILVITTPRDRAAFEHLLGDGHAWGIELSYAVQHQPGGIAQAFSVAASFIGDSRVALILGDNIFYGHGLGRRLRNVAERPSGATIFAYQVRDPERYGVVGFDRAGQAVSLEEKPQKPQSSFAVAGIYFYGPEVVAVAAGLRPSARGELEITDVNRHYLDAGTLQVEVLQRGIAWLDTGTHESLLQAGNFIATVEDRQGLKIACLEEIAYRMGYIDAEQVRAAAKRLEKTGYGPYLSRLIQEDGVGI